MPRRAACSGRPSRRSASAWSAMPRSASGSAATRALPRSATACRPRRWALAATSSPPRRCSSSPPRCSMPALLALHGMHSPREIDPRTALTAACRSRQPEARRRICAACCGKRPLLIFGGCILLFHLANAAMLPLMASVLTMRSGQMGDGPDRRLHRGAAAHRRAVLALGRPAGAALGAPAAAARRLRRAAGARPAVCRR